jgi:hypothetical protein
LRIPTRRRRRERALKRSGGLPPQVVEHRLEEDEHLGDGV